MKPRVSKVPNAAGIHFAFDSKGNIINEVYKNSKGDWCVSRGYFQNSGFSSYRDACDAAFDV